MKKTIFLLITLFFLSITCYASTMSGIIYEYDDITVVFDENSSFSADKQKQIADSIAGIQNNSGVSTAGLTCSLLGHDLTTEYVIVYQHKILATEPRCVKQEYNISSCSRCDYTYRELISTTRIYCCPEE